MIELLLQAERALSVGLVDQAERLYRQAADNDPRNAIAVVGLARVALERADDATAYREALRALDIDPENVAARRLVVRLEEVFAARREALPSIGSELPTSPGSDRSPSSRSEASFSGSVPPPPSGAGPTPAAPTVPSGSETAAQPPSARADATSSAPAPPIAPASATSSPPTPSAAPAPATSPTSTPTASNTPATPPVPKPRPSSPSLIDRLLRRKRS